MGGTLCTELVILAILAEWLATLEHLPAKQPSADKEKEKDKDKDKEKEKEATDLKASLSCDELRLITTKSLGLLSLLQGNQLKFLIWQQEFKLFLPPPNTLFSSIELWEQTSSTISGDIRADPLFKVPPVLNELSSVLSAFTHPLLPELLKSAQGNDQR